MKKKVLLSSILTIVICLCLIAGSTFALFTANDEFNIAVTAGEVAVDASAEISQIYSARGVVAGETAEDEFLVDENNEEYKHEALGKNDEDRWIFTNGGEVVMDGEGLKLSRLTPGDKVDVKINVANNSDVAIQYRYKIFVNEEYSYSLAPAMVLSILEDDDTATQDDLTFAVNSYERFESYTSEWYSVAAPDGAAEPIESRMISVELPVYAGNAFQKKSVTYTVLVEAVQGNSVTHNEPEVVLCQVQEASIANVTATTDESGFFPENTTTAYIHDVYLFGDSNIVVDQNNGYAIEGVVANVDGSAIIMNEYNPAICIVNCEFNLDEGEYIIDASAIPGGVYQIFMVNVRVNGELVPVGANIDQYLNNVNWYQVADPIYFFN